MWWDRTGSPNPDPAKNTVRMVRMVRIVLRVGTGRCGGVMDGSLHCGHVRSGRKPQTAVPPTVRPPILSEGWPMPTGTP